MDLRRVRAWEWSTGLGGVVLLVSLFLPWYSLGGEHLTGWQAFTVIDVIIALAALSAIALPAVAASQRTAAVPQAMSSTIVWLLVVAAVLALVRLANPPGDLGRAAGVWIAALTSLALIAFDVKSMRDKRFPAAMRPRLDIETIAAPAADGSRRDLQ